MMKILVACPLRELALDELRALGAGVSYAPDLTAERLASQVPGVAILVVDQLRVSPEVISRGRALQLIVRAGTGVGNIAADEAAAQGIFVTHCPDKEATAIAELMLGLMVALDRSLVESALAMRADPRREVALAEARGLAGRTLGIFGFDPVGQLVAPRARALEMRVLAWSPTLTPERAARHGVEFCNWPRVLGRKSDIVTVHTPPEGDEGVLLDAEFLDSMRPGAYLVHVGHPAAVDRAALAEAVERKRIRVACDLSAPEAAGELVRGQGTLLERPGVICTHRLATATQQARNAVAAEVVRIVRAFLVSGEALNCVNLCERSPATWQLVMRVRDRVGVMAAILETIRSDGINAEEITSRVFTGAKAACCTVSLDERPSAEALETIRALPDVLHLELRATV